MCKGSAYNTTTNCSICPVSTYLAASGGTAPAACAACAAGTVALFGASGCYASQPGDGFASSPILGFFERPLPVPTNNLASTPLLLATATVALPIVGAALLPYLLYLLSTIRGCPRGYVRVVQGSLAVVDSYAIKAPQKDGQSPTMQRSAAGGAVFILIIGVVVALMCSTLATYFYANTLLQQALLPLTYAAQVSFKSLAFVVPLTSALPTGEPALAPIAADGAGGLAITLRAMGARCGTLLAPGGGSSNGTSAFSYSIAQGAFTYSTSFDTATFNAVHTLRCAACSFDSLSFVALTFDGTCQAFAATVSAVGVGGGVSVSSASIFAAAPWSSASVTFPLTLQVVQDTILGTQRDSDSLWLGGASCTGLAVGSATNYDAPVAGSAAAITVTLKLALQSQYVGNTLTQITSTLKLFSAMSAWLSLLGAGAILLIIHNAAASRFAPAKPAAAAAAVKLSEQQQREKMWSVGGPPPEVAAARASMAQPSSRMASTPVVASLPPTAIAEVGDAYADDGQRGGVDVVNPMRSVELDDAAAAAPLPPGWSEKFSRSRQAPYWLSDVDGAATWVRPTEPPPGVGY